MSAIGELIKAVIPFGIGFLFLWGIGRMCCTTSVKQKPNGEQAKPGNKEVDSDDSSKQKKDMFDSKKEISSGKKDMMSSQDEMMKRKSDLFSSRKSMIDSSDEPISELDLILSLPTEKQRRLKPLQKAYLLKEILDSPKAIKPYRRRYPR